MKKVSHSLSDLLFTVKSIKQATLLSETLQAPHRSPMAHQIID